MSWFNWRPFHRRNVVSFNKQDVEQSIATRFEQQVTQHADRIAVATRREKMSYIALNAAANQVGRAILRVRGESNEPIAVLLENGLPTIAAIVGVLKAGKICLPIDPANPEARTALILEDSGAQLMLTNSKYFSMVHDLIGSRREVLNVEEIDSGLPTENLTLLISPNTPAYIIYTSGSMGLPKGVVHTQRNVLHNAMRFTHGCGICAQDRVILLASVSTGQGTPTALSALLNGAALYPFDIKEEGIAGLSSWLSSERITVYISTPTVFRHFVLSLRAQEDFPELRIIRLGSERILKSDVELYRRYFSNYSTLAIFFSATEAGNISQYFINRDTEIGGSVIPAGYPADDMEVIILKDDGTPAECNEMGEIAVRSSYLSPGYWRRPDLTRMSFRDDEQNAGKLLYLTGDLGIIRKDGCFEHHGRKGLRVKVRGYTVNLEEIEAVLRKHPSIRDAAITTRQSNDDDVVVIAYIVPTNGNAPTIEELRRHVRQNLPDYMLPSFFVFLETLPMTSGGKLNRAVLPDPGGNRLQPKNSFVGARTPIETRLADIWVDVLEFGPIGVKDNFFDLGGHSLTAMRIASRIAKIFQIEMPLSVIFGNPTVEELASVIAEKVAKH